MNRVPGVACIMEWRAEVVVDDPDKKGTHNLKENT